MERSAEEVKQELFQKKVSGAIRGNQGNQGAVTGVAQWKEVSG